MSNQVEISKEKLALEDNINFVKAAMKVKTYEFQNLKWELEKHQSNLHDLEFDPEEYLRRKALEEPMQP